MRLIAKFGSMVLVSAFAVLTHSGCSEEKTYSTLPTPDNDDISTDPIPDDPGGTPAFISYCHSQDNPEDVQHTVDALIEYVTYEPGEALDCPSAYERLTSEAAEILLPNKGIRSLKPFGGISGVYEIDLTGNEISDLAGLGDVPDLWSLDLSSNKVSDLKPLEKLRDLYRLHLGDNPLKDIEPVSRISTLRVLTLSKNLIDDASSLANTPIERLDIRDQPHLVDYSFVGEMRNLFSLDIVNANLNSLDFLTPNNKSLRAVNFSRNRISDITPLSKLPQLEGIIVNFSEVETIGDIHGLPQLRYLMLLENNIKEIKAINSLESSKLESLDIAQNKDLRDLSFIENHKKLYELDFSHCSVVDVPDLSEHKELLDVFGSYNQLSKQSVHNIFSAKNVLNIKLDGNNLTDEHLATNHETLSFVNLSISDNDKVTSLDFLSKAPDLAHLDTWFTSAYSIPDEVSKKLFSARINVENSKEAIRKIFAFPSLYSLALHASDREVFDIELADVNNKLVELELRSGPIHDTSFLRQLPNVTSLDLRSLKVRSLDDILTLELYKLNLGDNCIESVKPLAEVTKIWDTLEELNLEDNQITDLDLLPADKLAKLKIYKAEKNGKKKEGCGI